MIFQLSGTKEALSCQYPQDTWATRLRRQAATGYAPAPVLRTKPCASLPHREGLRFGLQIQAADSRGFGPQIRARHEIVSCLA